MFGVFLLFGGRLGVLVLGFGGFSVYFCLVLVFWEVCLWYFFLHYVVHFYKCEVSLTDLRKHNEENNYTGG